MQSLTIKPYNRRDLTLYVIRRKPDVILLNGLSICDSEKKSCMNRAESRTIRKMKLL